jgi:hypothetical protein
MPGSRIKVTSALSPLTMSMRRLFGANPSSVAMIV